MRDPNPRTEAYTQDLGLLGPRVGVVALGAQAPPVAPLDGLGERQGTGLAVVFVAFSPFDPVAIRAKQLKTRHLRVLREHFLRPY